MESASTLLPRPDLRRRGRLSLAAGRALIASWRSSGLSVTEYCRAHGHSVATLERWLAKGDPTGEGTPPRFVEVCIDRPVCGSIDIITGSGAVVRVGREFDAAHLRAVVSALSSGC